MLASAGAFPYQDSVCIDTSFSYDSYLQEDYYGDDTNMPLIAPEAGHHNPEDKKESGNYIPLDHDYSF
jgi:hypothetical protein